MFISCIYYNICKLANFLKYVLGNLLVGNKRATLKEKCFSSPKTDPTIVERGKEIRVFVC